MPRRKEPAGRRLAKATLAAMSQALQARPLRLWDAMPGEWATAEVIARRVGWPTATVLNALPALVDAGLVEAERRKGTLVRLAMYRPREDVRALVHLKREPRASEPRATKDCGATGAWSR